MSPSTSWQDRADALWLAFDAMEPDQFLDRMTALTAERADDDPEAFFEQASAHDSIGQEIEAETLYRQSLRLGLSGLRRRQAVIQLASTLRNLGRPIEALALLEREQAEPSDELDDALTAFLALVLADLGRDREALSLSLSALSRHLPRYNRSLANYATGLVAPAKSLRGSGS